MDYSIYEYSINLISEGGRFGVVYYPRDDRSFSRCEESIQGARLDWSERKSLMDRLRGEREKYYDLSGRVSSLREESLNS